MINTTNLAQFGLPNPVTWAPAATPLSGRTNLVFDNARQPEGLLLKKVPSLEAALDAGGLFLRKVGTDRWMFLLRDTLVRTLLASKLGKFVTDTTAAATLENDVRLQNVVRYSTIRNPANEYWTRSVRGYYVRGATAYSDYFAPGDQLEAFGVVTGATRGMGISHFNARRYVEGVGFQMTGSSAYSYSATDTPMSTTLTAYLLATKTAYLATIDNNIRPYFASEYDRVAAGRLIKPTISALIVWKDGLIASVPVAEERYSAYDKAFAKQQFGVAGKTADQVGAMFEADGTISDMSHYYGGNYTPEQAESGDVDGTTPRVRLMFARRFGMHLEATPAMPVLGLLFGDTIVTTRSSPTGTIGSYQAGRLIDAQVLGRSLVSGVTYHDQPSNYANLATYVNGTFSTIRGREALAMPANATLEMATDSVLRNEATLASIQANAFAAGSLPLELDRFIVELNAAARDKAEGST